MKKTLLALAVVTAAGSAQAGVNLYDNNGVKVDLSGAAEVQYHHGFEKDTDADIRLDDGDIALHTTVAIAEQLNAVAGMSFEFENEYDNTDGRSVKNKELFVGFGSAQFGTITFGRQYLVFDDVGNGMDYEGAIGLSQSNRQELDAVTNFDDVIKYTYDNGMFYAGLSHKMDNSGKGQDSNSVTDGRVGFRIAGLDTRVYYADFANAKIWNLEADYALAENIMLAASYGQGKVDHLSGKATQLGLAGSYTFDKTTFALGYNHVTDDAGIKEKRDYDNVYANVTQQLHSNVKVYAELGWLEADHHDQDYDLNYTAGLEVSF
ncbi:TPA: porin [Photobacterium damselae]|uniref:porin n=1 Tax=Photobacterium damselae TaxID=38293 RepID=UPI0020909B80|nr:porin [Photobacterium damselae]USR78074.1 porin [Photobacterium damselae]